MAHSELHPEDGVAQRRSVVTSLDDLLRQARRLRFTDATLEARFQGERHSEGLLRSQVAIAVALLYVAVLGWWQAQRSAASIPEVIGWNLYYRFFVVAPTWLLLLISTFLPGHARRAEWMYGGGTVGVLFGLVLMSLGFGPYTNGLAAGLTVDFGLVLLTSVIVLPMRFRTLVLTAVGGAGGGIALLVLLLPPDAVARGFATANFVLAALVAVALGWGRERGDRTLFTQREHARALNAELAEANAQLARLNAEKNEFMAVAAHDLRAPLGIVRGLLELLRDRVIRDETKRTDALSRALGETERMHALVDNYLGAHAAENGALPVRLARIDLGAMAAAVAARHVAAAEAKGQTLAVEAPLGRVWVRADEALLAQVGDNFVTNAIKFSPRGAPVRVELQVAENGSAARLAVSDEGPGIALEEQGRLFQKFGRLAAKPTGGETSTGLGLAVAKRLAEAMGGSVGCETEAGRGATFWIELPGEDTVQS